ncbi:MAG: hypothetical protein ACNS62_21335 [Candidatus Cyclobacteriaceae bacterium M3_2C_046]
MTLLAMLLLSPYTLVEQLLEGTLNQHALGLQEEINQRSAVLKQPELMTDFFQHHQKSSAGDFQVLFFVLTFFTGLSLLKLLRQKVKWLTLILFFSFLLQVEAQPVTGNDPGYTEYHYATEEVDGDYQAGYSQHATTQSLDDWFIWAGALVFGLIFLRFFKLKVVLLILGMMILLMLGVEAQPVEGAVNNGAYFGESTLAMGPVVMNESSGGPGPGPGVPIDNGILFLMISGVAIGTFYIWKNKRALQTAN